jgi:hypothetical protein
MKFKIIYGRNGTSKTLSSDSKNNLKNIYIYIWLKNIKFFIKMI